LQEFLSSPIAKIAYKTVDTTTTPCETTRAAEIAIKTTKNGEVTAVVTVMSIFSKHRCNSRSANSGNDKPSCRTTKSTDFPEENSRGSRNLSQKTRKGRFPKKLASKLKKLELTSTNLELKSKKHIQIAPKA
jgi:hypothetical protein